MKHTLYVFFVFLTPFVMAQNFSLNEHKSIVPSQKHLKVFTFKVNNNYHVHTEGVAANSQIHYYKNTDGGEYLGHDKSRGSGENKKIFTKQNVPGFVLTETTSAHLSNPEFWLKEIVLDQKAEAYQLSMHLEANLDNSIHYEIHLVKETSINVVYTNKVEVLRQKYLIDLPAIDEGYYELQLFTNNNHRYSQKLVPLKAEKGYLLYPNISKSIVHIELLLAPNKGHYKLYNSQGQMVNQGELTNSKTALNIERLRAGTYHIVVYNNGQQWPTKSLVKLP